MGGWERWTWKPWIPIFIGIFVGWQFDKTILYLMPHWKTIAIMGRIILTIIGVIWGIRLALKDREDDVKGWMAPVITGIIVIMISFSLISKIRN